MVGRSELVICDDYISLRGPKVLLNTDLPADDDAPADDDGAG